MSIDDRNHFIGNFENELGSIDADCIKFETILNELSEWDSLAVIQIIEMIDEEYSVSLTSKQLASCSTVNDIYCLVTSKGND